ncbi:hypothetical protein BGX38DRAFT_283998 [Terfezia claveryi]|nr:hypothetical protein BGX38DRAFT_283998 [Terfezia claveryi]
MASLKEAHDSPPVPFSFDVEFPIQKVITGPEEEVPIPDLVFNPDEYTIEDLWTVLAKQGKLRKLRVLLMGRKVKGSLAMTLMNKMSRERNMCPIINREDTAKWLILRKYVFDELSELQKIEWGLLSGLMVVSKGGRLLDPNYSNKQEVLTTSNPLTTGPVTNISTLYAHTTHRAGEYLQRLGNIPRVRRRSITSATDSQATLASLEERVRQLEMGSQLSVSEGAQSFTGRGNAQLPKDLGTNLPAGGSRGDNREASAVRSSSSTLGLQGCEFSDSVYYSEDSEDGGELYEEQTGSKSQSVYSDCRRECQSPVDWVALAD